MNWKFWQGRKKVQPTPMEREIARLTEQLEIAKKYRNFIAAALERGYRYEIIIVVDGQFCPASLRPARDSKQLCYMLVDAESHISVLESELLDAWSGKSKSWPLY